MSNNLKKSLEDLKSLNKLFSSVKEIAEAFQDIQSMESAVVMAESKKNKALKELADSKASIDGLNKELSVAKESKKDTENQCIKMVKDAEKSRDEIIWEASSKKNEILLEVSDLRKKADLLANGMSVDLVNLKKEISEKQYELDVIKSKIHSTKESLRQLIG